MGAASLSYSGKILFLFYFCSILHHCFLLIEILMHISNLVLHHNPDTSLRFAVSGHVPFFVTIVTFNWWALHLASVYIHRIGISQQWDLLLLLLLPPIWLQWIPKGLSWQGWWWWWSWHLLCGGLPQCTLINFAIKGLFSPGNSPLMICPNHLIVPLFDSDQSRSQLSQTSPKSLVQGLLELNN